MRRTDLLLMILPFLAMGSIAVSQVQQGKTPPSAATESPEMLPTGSKSPTRPMPKFVDRFRYHDTHRWAVSNGWRNGSYMVNDWRASQAHFGRGLELILEQRKSSLADFASGEVQSRDTYGYGYFETAMRTAPGSGVVSALFTYTGPTFGDPWNEIDIEVIGRNPHAVMFTYFNNGKKESKVVTLPFDTSQETHVYGFDWQPEYIRWYVDGQLMHEVRGTTIPLPTRRQKIMTQVWGSSTLTDWLGPFDAKTLPVRATFACVSYSASYQATGGCR